MAVRPTGDNGDVGSRRRPRLDAGLAGPVAGNAIRSKDDKKHCSLGEAADDGLSSRHTVSANHVL